MLLRSVLTGSEDRQGGLRVQDHGLHPDQHLRHHSEAVKGDNVWHHPKCKTPLYPVFQILGVGGVALLFVMGKMAFIGASVAGIAGTYEYALR